MQKAAIAPETATKPVTCPTSPTNAHWYNCQYRLDGQANHSHEYQTCKYCGFEQITPCYWCEDKETKVKTRGERFNQTLPKPKKKQVAA